MGTYHLRALDSTRGIARVFAYSAWSMVWFVAPAAIDKLKRSNPKIREMSFRAFHTHETFRSHLFSKRKMKILFSRKEDWEKPIKDGFFDTPHEIAFEDFTPHNIKDYDLIVPLTQRDLIYLSKVRNLISDNPIPVPSMESILLCHDKYLLNQSLAANGFGPFIPKIGRPLTYPYILKKRIDQGGRNSHVISDERQEQIFSGTLNDSGYFFQDLIKGPYEYATHILFKNQRIMHSLNIEYRFNTETPIKGKDKPIYRMICHCPYLDVFAAMLTSIGFDGLCCVNYKVSDNHLFLLEINPRFGGSLSTYFFSFIRHIA